MSVPEAPESQWLATMLRVESAEQIRTALSELWKMKLVAAATRLPSFSAFVAHVEALASQTRPDAERVVALSILAGIRSGLKLRSGPVIEALRRLLEDPPPPLQLLSDPDDRMAVASALALGQGEWLSTYASDSIVAEDTAPNTREQLADILLSSAPLSEALVTLSAAWSRMAEHVEAQVITRRFRRTLQAMRKSLPRIEAELGTEPGDAVRRLLNIPAQHGNVVEDKRELQGLAGECLGFLHDLFRAHPTAITDPDVAASVSILKSWFHPGIFLNWVRDSEEARALRRDITNGLILLGKQGLMSESLRERMIELAGGGESGRNVLRELSVRHPELPPAVRHWMESGKAAGREQAAAFEDSAWAEADRQLAMALLSALRAKRALQIGEDAAEDDLVEAVLRVGAARNLRVAGSPGDVVTFSPYAHQMIGTVANAVRVRIVRPLVERVSASGQSEVVLRALVEPADQA